MKSRMMILRMLLFTGFILLLMGCSANQNESVQQEKADLRDRIKDTLSEIETLQRNLDQQRQLPARESVANIDAEIDTLKKYHDHFNAVMNTLETVAVADWTDFNNRTKAAISQADSLMTRYRTEITLGETGRP